MSTLDCFGVGILTPRLARDAMLIMFLYEVRPNVCTGCRRAIYLVQRGEYISSVDVPDLFQ